MTGVASAVVAGAVVAAGASAYAANKTAGAARDAAAGTLAENAREFDLARADTAPARQLGANSIATLSKLYGYGPSQVDPNTGAVTGTPSGTPDMSSFFTSPDYSFNLQEGEKGVTNSLVARGLGLSGSQVKASTRYASGLASQQYGDYVNRLLAQAGLGQTGVNTSAQVGQSVAASDAAARASEANARASAYGTMASGVNNAAQGGISNYLLYRYLGAPA